MQFADGKHFNETADPFQYAGLPLDQMVHFDHCFKTNVNIYHLRDDGVVLTVYKSRCHYRDTMHVNQFDHHPSYISNLQAYAQKYQCGTYDRHFKHVTNIPLLCYCKTCLLHVFHFVLLCALSICLYMFLRYKYDVALY